MYDEQRPDSVRSAIELMAAWLQRPDGPPDLLIACLRHQLLDRPDGDELAAAVELIMGLVYFNGSLLVLREEETGVPTRQTVQQLAMEYARR